MGSSHLESLERLVCPQRLCKEGHWVGPLYRGDLSIELFSLGLVALGTLGASAQPSGPCSHAR